jgi:N-dimethylarginine dimethylaminohydrolase
MEHILITPNTFQILDFQKHQNPYIEPSNTSKRKVLRDHADLVSKVEDATIYTINPPNHGRPLPDIVFVANGGFSLWGLPEPILILPQMKYKQRKDELPYLKQICIDQGLIGVEFPSKEPFEGQAEAKWFHNGRLLVCGYGHRSTQKSFAVLDKLLKEIYGRYKRPAPKLLVLPLESADYYHLDVAMLEFNDDSCIVHKRAFSPESIRKLEAALNGKVHVIDTADSFCLNAVVQGKNLLTHLLTEDVKTFLESKTGLKTVQNETDIFEKSGGSVRCMILDIHPVIDTL